MPHDTFQDLSDQTRVVEAAMEGSGAQTNGDLNFFAA
jgi:hypothetical protein